MSCPKCGSRVYKELDTKVYENSEYRLVVRCCKCGMTYTKNIVRYSVPVRNGHIQPVIQLKDGEIVAKYGSIVEASRLTNVRACNISRCCLGYRSTAGGYEWRYGVFSEDKKEQRG